MNKGIYVSNLENEETKGTPLDSIFDTIAKSVTLKLDASYITSLGSVKGNIIISPFSLIFDPEASIENRKLIPVLQITL